MILCVVKTWQQIALQKGAPREGVQYEDTHYREQEEVDVEDERRVRVDRYSGRRSGVGGI